MTSVKDDNTADRRSPDVLNTDYHTVVHGCLGFSERYSRIPLALLYAGVSQICFFGGAPKTIVHILRNPCL